MKEPLLTVENLAVAFAGRRVVEGVSFTIEAGETLALVGESGSGKSVTALSALRLLTGAGSNPEGRIRLDGVEVLTAAPAARRRLRGGVAGMVFQEPMTSLNPLHSIEQQVGEAIALHRPLPPAALRARVLDLLHQVALPNAEERLGAYPHQLSGGQRQRVMIAAALANDPKLLIADEPTTALDVTIQAQVVELLRELQARHRLAYLFISHDLRVVRALAHRIIVLKDGVVVEQGEAEALTAAPRQPYTRALMAAAFDLRALRTTDLRAAAPEAVAP